MADDVGKYDDFLKRTGASDVKPDYAAFLARTGAVATAEPQPDTHYSDQGQNEYGVTGDPQQFNAQKPGISVPLPKTVADLRGALAETPGWTSGSIFPIRVKNDASGQADPSLGVRPDLGFLRGTGNALIDLMEGPRTGTVTPEASNLLFGAMVGGGLTPSVARGSGIPIAQTAELGAPKAALYDGAAAARTSEQGNLLAGVPRPTDAPPNALAGAPGQPGPAAPAGWSVDDRFGTAANAPPAPRVPITSAQVQRRDGVGYNEATRRAAAENAAADQPAPQSVGAAASRDMSPPGVIDMTPAEMKANRRQAEMKQILSPAEPGDTTIHVEGSLPTKAEYTGEASVSQEENLLRERSPDQFEGDKGRITANNAARVNKFEELTPSDTALQTMDRNRAAQAETDHAAIIQHATPADAQPALDVLDGVLNDKRNMNRESVQKNLSTFRARLFDEDGKLKTDPQELWGIRDDLTEKLDKIGADPQSTMGYVKKEALAFRNAIDEVLNKSTGGRYQTFLDNYAAASQEITAGNLLREFRSKLTNSAGTIQANRFHKFVTDLAEARGEKGIDPAMDIPDETMAHLIAIDTDLKRAGLIDLGKARGSPTNLLGALAQGMGLGAAHAGMAALSPGFGNLALQGAITHGTPILGKVMLNRKVRNHLAPPPGGYKPAHTD